MASGVEEVELVLLPRFDVRFSSGAVGAGGAGAGSPVGVRSRPAATGDERKCGED
jgi:hypothetical protein